MRNRWLAFALLIAMGALLMGAAACKSSSSGTKKTSTPAKTPAAATHTPSSGITPAATAGLPSAQGEVAVTLVEYQLKPIPTSVPGGSVKFTARNIGKATHQFMVVKTDLAPTDLPKKADGSYDEAAPGAEMIDNVKDIAPGTTGTLTLTLDPGKYVLICNVVQTTNGQTVSHYAQRMATEFTVTQ
jgi:uncharacterized cupredoxin-like copper-binding protein